MLGGRFLQNDAQIMETKALIDLYGQWISLRRPAQFEDDGQGGVVRVGDTTGRTLQKLYFEYSSPISHVSRNASFSENRGVGQKLSTIHVLIGFPSANIQQDDEFTVDGKDYSVLYINPDVRYQKKAEILLVTTPVTQNG